MDGESTTEDTLSQALTDLDLRSTPLIAQLDTKRPPATACESAGRTDSGYASQFATPDQSLTSECSHSGFPKGVVLPSRGLFPRKVTLLKPFDKEIPEATQHRFRDLRALFDEPLIRYLASVKPDVQLNSISIKLMVLGESEASAKPFVVVLCDWRIKKSLEKYFNQRGVRQHFQSHDFDPDIPSLDVVVYGKRPKPIALTGRTEVRGDFGKDASIGTLCGATIEVVSPSGPRTARIGGVVSVVGFGKPPTLYAITAGHIIHQEPIPDYKSAAGRDGDDDNDAPGNESEDEEDLFLQSEAFEIDLDGEEPCEEQEIRIASSTSGAIQPAGTVSASSSRIGFIALSSHLAPNEGFNTDWALVELYDRSQYAPNLLSHPDTAEVIELRFQQKLRPPRKRNVTKERVIVLNNTQNNTHTFARGVLSTFSSFFLLEPAKRLIQTHTLTLDEGSGKG